ncbi:hypothetical protein V2G26_002986 [Clonostachys chloroleuca]
MIANHRRGASNRRGALWIDIRLCECCLPYRRPISPALSPSSPPAPPTKLYIGMVECYSRSPGHHYASFPKPSRAD